MQFRSRLSFQPEQLFDIPAERVIVFARLVLAAFSLAAIYLDATQPMRYAPTAYALLIAYLLFAATYVIRTARRLPEILVANRRPFCGYSLGQHLDVSD